ncbi:ANTAR domain-containing protein [Geodermatophilus sp. DF01_2]|uniref:ANTAR domain-containing protein n=1 Tax=Geodermatophilus sp. DF01-2 TaxID=2559610 RepID=UPI001431DE1E|nr:ANTAR domain-containing protein [Geodermatophilus sp. DF01_2]
MSSIPTSTPHPDTPAVRPLPAEALHSLADLEVAHEELRVAEEEVRVQQEQIELLLSRYESERRWRSRLSGLVPVALAQTDGAGKLVDANAALATYLQVPLHRLAGKPLGVYLETDDEPTFRSAVRALSTGAADQQRLRVTLHGHRHGRATADLFGFPDTTAGQTADTRLQWVLIPAGHAAEVPVRHAAEPPTRADGEPAAVPTSADQLGLAAALAELSTLPIGDADRQRLLTRMAVLVQSAVPAATAVSITLGSPAAPQQLGSDSAVAQELDGRQLQAGEGPCWDAHRTGSVVVSPDLPADDRWPQLRPLLGESPVHGVLAVPLCEGEQPVGVLNAYSARVDAFRGDGRRIAELVAAAVGGVLQSVADRESLRNLAANLEKALTSRATIDQAKGVLMARLGIDADDAFTRLVALSNRLNVKLRDLAQLVVQGHADEVIAAAE